MIDSTWQQTKKILRDQKISGLSCVKIRTHKTNFWRFFWCLIYSFSSDSVDINLLVMITSPPLRVFMISLWFKFVTAIYFFVREWTQKAKGRYEGEFDDLLFYYSYMYELIQKTYQKDNKRFARIERYIQKDSKGSDDLETERGRTRIDDSWFYLLLYLTVNKWFKIKWSLSKCHSKG